MSNYGKKNEQELNDLMQVVAMDIESADLGVSFLDEGDLQTNQIIIEAYMSLDPVLCGECFCRAKIFYDKLMASPLLIQVFGDYLTEAPFGLYRFFKIYKFFLVNHGHTSYARLVADAHFTNIGGLMPDECRMAMGRVSSSWANPIELYNPAGFETDICKAYLTGIDGVLYAGLNEVLNGDPSNIPLICQTFLNDDYYCADTGLEEVVGLLNSAHIFGVHISALQKPKSCSESINVGKGFLPVEVADQETINKILKTPKLIAFLNLLGLDTAGNISALGGLAELFELIQSGGYEEVAKDTVASDFYTQEKKPEGEVDYWKAINQINQVADFDDEDGGFSNALIDPLLVLTSGEELFETYKTRINESTSPANPLIKYALKNTPRNHKGD